MNTTDPTPLQERIARAMHADDVEAGRAADEFEAMSAESIAWYMSNAAAVLPIIAAEVCKAKAEALREAADWWAANPDDDAFETDRDTRNWLRDVATEYETRRQR